MEKNFGDGVKDGNRSIELTSVGQRKVWGSVGVR